ncbi:MAG: biotin/lipoyl-binding protein [Candidatus Roizmanbacteria bacterium]|nr:biotin/lipoyl-binding protein [Candidatus Roizmanbacteria bacterium]
MAPKIQKKGFRWIRRHPWIVVLTFVSLALVLGIVSFVVRSKPEPAPEESSVAKQVSVYHIGSLPYASVQAKIEKTGVITILSQSSGVVSSVQVKPGEEVSKGTQVVSLSTNYQGGNALSVQRQMAQVQYQNIEETYPIQKDLLEKQRDMAEQTDENSEELREITEQSLDETKNSLNINNDILSILQKNLNEYQSTHSATTDNSSQILATKQLIAQYQSSTNQLNQALRSSEYQADDDNPPAELSETQREVMLRQLDLQEKSLELSREVSKLQLRLASINEGLMYPVAPFSGRVERVLVHEGQAVNPGTPLLVLHSEVLSARAIALVPQTMARSISLLEPSMVTIGAETVPLYPEYVASEPTDGQLFAVSFIIPDTIKAKIAQGSYIAIKLPIGEYQTGSALPFIPLDAVYQSENESYIFIVQKGQARTRKIDIGTVYGSMVTVWNGLRQGDRVIIDRTVVNGDTVVIAQ